MKKMGCCLFLLCCVMLFSACSGNPSNSATEGNYPNGCAETMEDSTPEITEPPLPTARDIRRGEISLMVEAAQQEAWGNLRNDRLDPEYDLYIYSTFREDIQLFLEGASMTAYWEYAAFIIGREIVSIRHEDPALYRYYNDMLSYSATLDFSDNRNNISPADILVGINNSIKGLNETNPPAGEMVRHETTNPYIVNPSRITRIADPQLDRGGTWNYNWIVEDYHDERIFRIHSTGVVKKLELTFASDNEYMQSMAVSTLLRFTYWGSAQTTIVYIAAAAQSLGDNAHERIADVLARRILNMRDAGYDIYRLYALFFSYPLLPVCESTFAVFEAINQHFADMDIFLPRTSVKFMINGEETALYAYEFDNVLYFALEDLSHALLGTQAQFSASESESRISITTHIQRTRPWVRPIVRIWSPIWDKMPHIPTQSEAHVWMGEASNEVITELLRFPMYYIVDRHYVVLSDFSWLLGFDVDWDAGGIAIICTKEPYISEIGRNAVKDFLFGYNFCNFTLYNLGNGIP
ncbi:MAG: hypothetical protein FWC73_14500, partial [Defluviitaleaceae bacterium]|nr:hypothetical protein [Defluviitaleaceae bacterium]